MKTNKLIKFFFVLALLIGTVSSCVEDSEFDTPQVNCQELPQPLVATHTISQIKAMYTTAMVKFDTEMVIEGYVVSSDETGNIYKTLSIQDKPENPTAGIKILINEIDYYLKYNVGRKIYVKLKGLALNRKDGVFEIGFPIDESFSSIPSTILKDHIFRTCETVAIVPKVVTIADLSNNFDMLIQLNDMQFKRADIDKNLAYALNTTSVNRVLEYYDADCFKVSEVIMRNSGFATFNNIPLPSGKGNVVAIPGKFGNDVQLYIRSTNDVKFDKPFCVEPAAFTVLDENFEKYASDNGYTTTGEHPLNLNGWTNFSTEGTVTWMLDKLSSNSAASFQAKTSPAGNYTGWLISPQLNMDNQLRESFTFKNAKLTGSATFEVFYSSNWDGTTANIATATWTKFENVVLATSSTYVTTTIDLAQFTGKIHIAFRYKGDNTQTAKWRVDDIIVQGRK